MDVAADCVQWTVTLRASMEILEDSLSHARHIIASDECLPKHPPPTPTLHHVTPATARHLDTAVPFVSGTVSLNGS